MIVHFFSFSTLTSGRKLRAGVASILVLMALVILLILVASGGWAGTGGRGPTGVG